MTREEAIEVIKQDIPCEFDADLLKAFEMAIKALEQKPILDKIRAEITEKENKLGFDCVSDVALKTAYIEVLQIIDKYRAESECMFSDYPDMPYQFDNMTGSMNL